MYFENILAVPSGKLIYAGICLYAVISYNSWKSLYYTYKSLKYQYEGEALHQKRHNCVVMYQSKGGYNGWPPLMKGITIKISDKDGFFTAAEPFIYFIRTSKTHLDIAFMLININNVYEAILDAHKRGVKVRLLINFENSSGSLDAVKELKNKGVKVALYVSHEGVMASIMHYKYMIKDYVNSGGYMCMGSMNLTSSGIVANYEDLVFSSNKSVVGAFSSNFEKCWNYVEHDNESIINKTVLCDVNLL